MTIPRGLRLALSAGLVLGALSAGAWYLIWLREPWPHIEQWGARQMRKAGVDSGTPPSPRRAAMPEPLRVGSEIKKPIQIVRVEPQYPEAARKTRMQGICFLEAIITKTGDVESVRVLRGLNSLLDNAAIRAVQQWKYKPATLEGKPVAVYLTVEIAFRL